VTRRPAQWEGGELRRIGFDVPKSDDTLFYTLVRQQGKDALNGDMTKAGFDPVEGERALQFEVDLLQRDRVDAYTRPAFPSGVEGLATPLLAARRTSSQVMARMQRAGVSARDVLVTDFTPEYAGKTTATGYLGGTWVAVNKDSGAPEEAIDRLLYLSGLEHSLAVAEATLTTPSRKSADKSALVQDPTLRPFYEALATAWSVPQHQKFEFVRRKVVELQAAALKQEKSVKEAVAEMIAQTAVQLTGG
jgi:ABC-type glycerol-3-phosphate transport system substrate-binding protein